MRRHILTCYAVLHALAQVTVSNLRDARAAYPTVLAVVDKQLGRCAPEPKPPQEPKPQLYYLPDFNDLSIKH